MYSIFNQEELSKRVGLEQNFHFAYNDHSSKIFFIAYFVNGSSMR